MEVEAFPTAHSWILSYNHGYEYWPERDAFATWVEPCSTCFTIHANGVQPLTTRRLQAPVQPDWLGGAPRVLLLRDRDELEWTPSRGCTQRLGPADRQDLHSHFSEGIDTLLDIAV